jgi:hypothetical protein
MINVLIETDNTKHRGKKAAAAFQVNSGNFGFLPTLVKPPPSNDWTAQTYYRCACRRYDVQAQPIEAKSITGYVPDEPTCMLVDRRNYYVLET